MTYGFDKARKPAAPAGEPKKLDLTGIDLRPASVTPDREAAALAAADSLGFRSREPGVPSPGASPAPVSGVIRRRQTLPMRNLFIKGPASVVDRFVAYTNETGADSYWQVLDELLKAKGR